MTIPVAERRGHARRRHRASTARGSRSTTLAGADILSYPAPIAPVRAARHGRRRRTSRSSARRATYSFAANVLDASGVDAPDAGHRHRVRRRRRDHARRTRAAATRSRPSTSTSRMAWTASRPTAHAVCVEANCAPATDGATVTITGIVVDNAGSGYSTAPNVVIRNGTLADPINPPAGFAAATATATLAISSIVVDDPGDGYVSAPTVTIDDPNRHRRQRDRHRERRRGHRAHPRRRRLRLHHAGHQEVRGRPAGALHAAGLPGDGQVHPARGAGGQEATTASRPTST